MTSQQPGRLPASVYRRRRLVVGLGVLAVIVVIVLLIVRPGAGADDTKKPGASDNPSANSSETPKADDSVPCDPASLTVTPVTDKESYQPGETPMISMTVKNGGAAACTVDLDATKQLYQIVSGSDPIWNSADCQTDAAKPFPQVLEPAQVLPLPAIPWDRTRSSADTCDADRAQVTAGGATYRLTVSLGEATSAGDVAFLLF